LSDEISVHKLDALGQEQWVYTASVLVRGDDFVRLEGHFDRERAERAGLIIRRADRMVETHFRNRWYNVFAIYEGDGPHLKGWYCNITRPARIEEHDIYADDLALDLVVLADGSWHVVDEDEFEALILGEVDRRRAREALAELKALAAAGEAPFNV
jgi:uncharacterized protein